MIFATFFWDKLSEYFHTHDTYLDSNDKGLLQRYLGLFGEYIDDNLWESIENYVQEVDPLVCDLPFLNLIGYTLGSPPDIFQGNDTANDDKYRRFLSYLISIYKIKGTLQSYQAMFGFLGFTASLVFNTNTGNCTNYDSGVTYDSGGHYDTCCGCSHYDLVLGLGQQGTGCISSGPFMWDLTTTPITAALQKTIDQILCFIQPIDVECDSTIPGLFICEQLTGKILEDVTGVLSQVIGYDIGPPSYDDPAISYDSTSSTTSFNIYP